MGAKTSLLAYTDGDVAELLRAGAVARPDATVALIARVFPGWTVEPADATSLDDAVHPPDGTAYAGAFPGVDLVCDRRLPLGAPSRLPDHLIEPGRHRRVISHAMHSVSDWFAFSVWDNGELVRSLSLDPDNGVVENAGEPFAFEAPFWSGEHPVLPTQGWPDQGPYPLPFHPLDLGEAALRGLFGFILEGSPSQADIDPDAVELHGFRLHDPAAPDPAHMQQLIRRMRRRSYTYAPDGSLVETDLKNRGQPGAG
ncbi:hypothetical protein GCM10009827_040490 [Dactylosporangium maewongense]|uniref:Uncharacterized protein n=1 Tax=Dactylosporangium maewongense TaxID=634393 RepID=A0ABN2AKL9_9ACTN